MTGAGFRAQKVTTPGSLGRAHGVTGATLGRRRMFHPGSIAWPAAAAAAFTFVVLLSSPLRMSLGWDEVVYASQISQHVPIMPWASERARGMPLLVAPVTLVSGSAFALRCYVAVLGGIALFLALLAWRGTRPAWQLGLAGVIFGGLGVTQAQAWQVYPNYWIAVGCLAGAGLAARSIRRGRASPPALAALAAAAAFTALMRPADAVAAFAPLLLLAVLALRLRAVSTILAALGGLVIGIAEWVIEANRYFGGPLARMKSASGAVGGTHLNLLTSLRILDGDTINTVRAASVPGHPGIAGWSHPWLLAWWAALLVLVIMGVLADRRARGWCFALLPVLPALCTYLEYSLVARDNVRYLLPAWALLAVPAARGIGWLAAAARGRGRARPARLAAAAVVAAFLATELVSQHVLAVRLSADLVTNATREITAANGLRRLGVRAPCVITTVGRPHYAHAVMSAAYYTGCTYPRRPGRARAARHRRQVVVLMVGHGRPWPWAANWPGHKIPGPGNFLAYISLRPARSPGNG